MSTPDLSQHQHDEEGGDTHDHAPIPPMQNHTLDLRTLTSSEEQILRKVIERDAQEMESLDNRISLIRKDIQDIRVRGALVEGDHQNTMCARCKHKFWLIPLPLTDRGVRCIRCKFRICAKCRFRQINNTWLCILCLRYREEKILSGEWMFNGPIIGLFGSDLMRASLRDKGRPKRRSPEANEDSALINSTSGTPLRDNNGDVRASSPGAQRRDSYSKALENQKIRVILPKGNGDDVDGRTDRPHADATHPESTIPMHGGNDDLDESDKESIHSSLSSPSSNRPISKNASTNSSFSSKSSSQSMPTIDNRRARQHSDSSSVHQKSEDEDAYVRGGGNSRYGDRSSMHSGGGGDGLHDYDHTKPGSVGRDSSSERKNSFEEIYDSNVNRLVKMMTAGQVSDSSTDARRSSPRLLPRPPDSDDAGKDTAAAEPTAGSKDVEEAGAGAKSKNGERDPKDSVRDSDSGVNSSQTSRANTPDQRSLSSGGDKGFKLNANTNASPSDNKSPPEFPLAQVPTIAVTEEAREEDDDLDELFSQHRHPYGGSNLSARSSLRDSRESLYSVYSAAGEDHYGDIPVTGEVQFHLEYNYKTGALSIHVKQCKELAPVDTKKNRSDPYVKTYLLPDKTRNGKRKTKIKRHTLNPTYNETLTYTIAKTELESRTLWLSVWNNDRFGRNDFLGEVTIPLDYYEFDKSAPTWYTLQDRLPSDDSPAMTYKGDLFISLKYVPASMVSGTSTMKKKGSLKRKDKTALKTGLGEIHVLVKEAHNLTAMRSGGGSNPFCKGYLLPDETHHSKQKTPVVKKTTSPNWQHLLVFEGVDETELENHGVELTVWDHETLSSNDFLGGVRLNTGTGYIRGKATDWMDARGEEIEVWQRMTDRHNEWIDIQLPLRASMGKPKK